MSTRRQYILNILWSWLGAAALILNGMLVAPYLIRHLGVDTQAEYLSNGRPHRVLPSGKPIEELF